MKRLLQFFSTGLLALIIIALLLFTGKRYSSYYSLGPYRDADMEHEDGMEKAAFQEFLMSRDPALNSVPIERIIEAKKRMEEIDAATAKTFETNQTSSLSWQERGPNNIGGRTRAILIDKNDATGNTVWAAGINGGLWKTTNFKSSPIWIKIDDFFANLAITSIAQDPSNPQVIYFGTGEGWFNIDAARGLGIWKSSNGGNSWSQLSSTNNSTFYYVQKIVVNNAGVVFAATRNGGLRRSLDGGATWTAVLSTGVNGGSTIRAADVELGADNSVYCSLGIFTNDGIYRSSDGGSSWTKIYTSVTDENRIELACAPGNSNVMYALIQDSDGPDNIAGTSDDDGIKKIISTSNATAVSPTWTTLTTPSWCDQGSSTFDFTRNQAWYDLIAAVDPNNDQVVYIGGVDVLKTTNGGSSWTQVTQWASGCGSLPSIHADIHSIQFFGSSSTEMVFGTDGGIFYTTNGGASLTKKNTGYNVTQYYSVAVNPASGSNIMIAGAQDNGSHYFSTSGINTVSSVTGGDGGFCFIDQTNSSVWITSYTGSVFNVFRSNGTYLGSTNGSDGGHFIDPADYDNTLNVLYYGASAGSYGHLNNVESGTASYTSVSFSAEMGGRQVSAIKSDPNNPHTIWLGCSTPGTISIVPNLLKITNADGDNAGPPASRPQATVYAGPSLPVNSYISSIDIEAGNSNHMLLTVSNYGVASIWESTDGGMNWASLDNNGVNLPDMPVRWGIFIPGGYTTRTDGTTAIGGIMIATELGVWTTNSSNGTSTAWAPNNIGLANVRVDHLVLRSSDKLVAAATHGRGLFTTILTSGTLPVTLLNFTGQLQQNSILLEWKTSLELNSSYFDLEKSYDGTDYHEIAKIAASGNSNTVRQYSYLDQEPPSEFNYYRLKMVDIDGNFTYAPTILVKNPDITQSVRVYGNPFRNSIILRLSKKPQYKVQTDLLNISGTKLVHKEMGASYEINVDFSGINLPPGPYLLRTNVDGQTFLHKLIKQ